MSAFIGQAQSLWASGRKLGVLRRTIAFISSSVASALLASAAFAQAGADWKTVEDAAKKEGTVSLYHNLRPSGIEKLLSEFRKA